ncbi:MAG: universal stress protein [Ferruginibacter sp.]|jgi:nucleotide-binding universal stress UspA family protein
MNSPKKNMMLVPTDFSQVAELALEHAIMIAKTFDNDIALLAIYDTGNLITSIFSKNATEEMVEKSLQTKLDVMKEEIKQKHGIDIITVVRSAYSIYKTIVEVAEELDCDSIVMGTHGASGLQKIMGSNAQRVISQAGVPVIVIKGKHFGDGYKNIIFPIDLSFETRQKVKWAIHLAKKFNSTIHILTFREDDEFLGHKINANINNVEAKFNEAGVKYTSFFLKDKNALAKETINYAENIKADLIMIMTQQDEDLKEIIIGSYAQQIVNNSPIPVMTVTPTTKGITEVVRAL